MGSSCTKGTLRLDGRENFSTEEADKPWHRLFREVVESLFPKRFRRCVDVALGDVLVVALSVLG